MGTWLGAFVACLIASLLSAGSVVADTLSSIDANQRIVIGYRTTSKPFSFKNAAGLPDGYQVDLCKGIAERIKLTLKLPQLRVEFREVASQDRIRVIKANEIDLECASTTITNDRLKEVDFSYATFITGIRFAVRRDAKLTSMAELQGRAVAVGKQTTAERLLKAGESTFRFKSITSTTSSPEAFKLLESGAVDAVFTDEPLLLSYIANSKSPSTYVVAGKYLSVEPYGLMLRKDDAPFKAAVNTALLAAFSSGQARRLHDRWFDRGEVPMPLNRLTKETFAYPSSHPAFP
jgi:glutamate/aspartate transport system substrate-binding protein